jgi:hypothetical protein
MLILTEVTSAITWLFTGLTDGIIGPEPFHSPSKTPLFCLEIPKASKVSLCFSKVESDRIEVGLIAFELLRAAFSKEYRFRIRAAIDLDTEQSKLSVTKVGLYKGRFAIHGGVSGYTSHGVRKFQSNLAHGV